MNDDLKYRPLERAGDILFFACTAAFFLVVFVLSVGKIGSGVYSWQAAFGGAVAGVIGFFFILNIRKCGDESFSFTEYLRRNVRGYYKVFTWTAERHFPRYGDGSIKEKIKAVANNPLYVERRKLRTVLAMERSLQLIVAIPLGGWIARPKMVCDWIGGCRWKIGGVRSEGEWTLKLFDERGSRLSTQAVQDIARLAEMATNRYVCELGTTIQALFEELDTDNEILREYGEDLRKARGILYQATQQIEQTKRFQHSKEGARIREWLTRELTDLLPEYDPRKAELRTKLDSEAAKAGT